MRKGARTTGVLVEVEVAVATAVGVEVGGLVGVAVGATVSVGTAVLVAVGGTAVAVGVGVGVGLLDEESSAQPAIVAASMAIAAISPNRLVPIHPRGLIDFRIRGSSPG